MRRSNKEYEMMKTEVPEGTTCRALGCSRKATVVVLDTKGRRQYCCDKHVGKNKVKEKKQ